ncbi:mitochondrial zinc maintenance protein 1, mitochondrial-like isoform X1 [Curcuma longa]|uniref:mitochondrial zinc maintenance protein 1, mitochondrial-like isoform X1 n=1 Tax=Curcuma longa TaxID=136217 RepID=UPI003D9E5352
MGPARAEALAAYRALLRATRKTFASDTLMLSAWALEIRLKFEANRRVAAEAEVKRLLNEARGAFHLISHRIVQAKHNTPGGFSNDPPNDSSILLPLPMLGYFTSGRTCWSNNGDCLRRTS